ncbi:hypothetical protein Tco_1198761 [Tanacetum coccineum]
MRNLVKSKHGQLGKRNAEMGENRHEEGRKRDTVVGIIKESVRASEIDDLQPHNAPDMSSQFQGLLAEPNFHQVMQPVSSGRSGTLVGQGSIIIVSADADYLPDDVTIVLHLGINNMFWFHLVSPDSAWICIWLHLALYSSDFVWFCLVLHQILSGPAYDTTWFCICPLSA